MNVKNVLITAGEDVLAKIEALLKEGETAATAIVVPIVVSDTQALVAKLKSLPIATAAMNTIELLEETGKSGTEKFAELVAKEGPALETAVEQAGGLKGLGVTLESLGEEYFNSLVNDFKAAVAKA